MKKIFSVFQFDSCPGIGFSRVTENRMKQNTGVLACSDRRTEDYQSIAYSNIGAADTGENGTP